MLQVVYSIFHFTTSTQPFLPETHCWIEGHHALFQPTIELQIGVNSFVAFWEKRILIEQHEEGKQAKKGCQCCLWLSESLISYFYEQPILKGLKCNTHVVSFVWTNVIWMSIEVWLTNKKDLVFSLFPRSRHFIFASFIQIIMTLQYFCLQSSKQSKGFMKYDLLDKWTSN